MSNMAAAPWTIQRLLTWTTEYLQTKGIETPRLDAQLLLSHVLQCPKIDLLVRYHEEPSAEQKAAFRELVKRRAEHWPTAYLIGQREFYLLPLVVSPAVLIPRPDTETLVVAAIDWLKTLNASRTARVLDIGTGSGCIAIAIAKNTTANILATDISPDAISIAKTNSERHALTERMTFRTGDLFAPVPSGERFDLIVSNPPYISPTEIATLAPEVRDHEPRLALDGGPDGLRAYRRLATEAAGFLTPGGLLMVEIGSSQNDAVRTIFADAGYELLPTLFDGARHTRVVRARPI
ncbi:MAG: peptide chain release factor N(5)-glutamine methyltransferase [Gemmataceae bacterium]